MPHRAVFDYQAFAPRCLYQANKPKPAILTAMWCAINNLETQVSLQVKSDAIHYLQSASDCSDSSTCAPCETNLFNRLLSSQIDYFEIAQLIFKYTHFVQQHFVDRREIGDPGSQLLELVTVR